MATDSDVYFFLKWGWKSSCEVLSLFLLKLLEIFTLKGLSKSCQEKLMFLQNIQNTLNQTSTILLLLSCKMHVSTICCNIFKSCWVVDRKIASEAKTRIGNAAKLFRILRRDNNNYSFPLKVNTSRMEITIFFFIFLRLEFVIRSNQCANKYSRGVNDYRV